MTKILLSGIAIATVLFVLGMSAQSFAMPMPDKTQNIVPSYALTKDAIQQLIVTCNSPTTKGGKATCHLGPKPQEGIDGLAIQTPIKPVNVTTQPKPNPQPEMILTSISTPGGGTALKWIPKPQEGIDGLAIPKAADPPTMLVAEPVTSKGGIAVLHLIPKPPQSSWDSVS